MDRSETNAGGLFPARVGERLAAEREAQGLSLDDVVRHTRIPRRHLEMIEAGNYTALPALTYSTGFVKTYGDLLGLDGPALSRDFRAEVGEVEQVRHSPEPFKPADPARIAPRMLAFVALGVAVLLAVAYMLWRGGASSADERASLAAGTTVGTTATPAVNRPRAPAAPAARPSAPNGPVVVAATEPVWVKVYDKQGGPALFIGEMAAGQRFTVPATAVDPMIWTGRPQVIRVTVGTQPIPPLGSADRRIKDVSLKQDALLARLAAPAAASPSTASLNAPAPAATTPPVTNGVQSSGPAARPAQP